MTILKFPRKPGAPVSRDAHPLSYRTIHGYRRAYVRVGSGPALLLLHGIGDSSETWKSIIPMLARDHTVIAPDLLGHGKSDKPRADYSVAGYANGMRDLITVLGIDKVTVVGHSLGGGVAMQFAYQYPERCERLVLVSSGGVSRAVHPALRIASARNADLVLPLLDLRVTRWLTRIAFHLLEALHTDIGQDADDLLRVFEALPDAHSRQAFVRTLRAVVDWRGQVITMLDRCYLTRGMPTLLVWGQRDAVIPFEHAKIAHEAMPGSRLEVFRDAGHFPHHTDPARFVKLLRSFLEETAPAWYHAADWRELLERGRTDSIAPRDVTDARPAARAAE